MNTMIDFQNAFSQWGNVHRAVAFKGLLALTRNPRLYIATPPGASSFGPTTFSSTLRLRIATQSDPTVSDPRVSRC